MAAQSTVMKRLLVLSLMCAICLHSLDSHLTNGYYSGRLVHRTGAAHHQTRLYAAIDGRIAGESTGSSSSPGKAKYTKKQARKPRFVHPQVLKMYKRAQALLRNGNNEVAGKLLVRCLELNPYDSYSWLSLARLEVKLGNVIKARDIFQQSMENCPDNVHILHAWGHMEEKQGNEQAARECYGRAMEIDPLNPYVCFALAYLEKSRRNFEKARELLETVYREKPTSANCALLAELEREAGNPEKAREVLMYGLQHCKEERSKCFLALAWLEEDYFGNTERALELVEEALRADPVNVDVYLARSNMALRMQDYDTARATLAQAVKCRAEDGKHFTMWGTVEIECGRYKDAQRILEEGARQYPADQYLLQRLGSLEHKHGSVQKARQIFERSVTIQPHAPTFVSWAILEEELGQQALDGPKPTLDQQKIDRHLISLSDSDNDSLGSKGADGQEAHEGHTDTLQLLTRDQPIDFTDAESIARTTGVGSSLIGKATYNPPDNLASNASSSPSLAVDPDIPALSSEPSIAAQEFVQNQFRKARELFELGALVDPRHGPLYHAFGTMEMRRGNITGARDILARGLAMNATLPTQLYHALGLLEIRDNNVHSAAMAFKRGIELGLSSNEVVDETVCYLLHSLGVMELDMQRPGEAEALFAQGNELFPGHTQMLLGLAMASMRLGKDDDARSRFRESVDADPSHAHAWNIWAIFEKQCGNYELARMLFQEGIRRNPNHGALWQAHAMLEIQQGDPDKARSLLSQAIARCPSHAQSYQAWACLEARLGNLEKAKALALQGMRKVPNHPALWTAAGLVEARLGNTQRARRIFKTGIQRFPNHGALYKVLGELESRQGVYLEAREVFRRGMEKDPHYAPLYHSAALLEAKIGNLEGLSQLHSYAKEHFNAIASSSSGGGSVDKPTLKEYSSATASNSFDVLDVIQKLHVDAKYESGAYMKKDAGAEAAKKKAKSDVAKKATSTEMDAMSFDYGESFNEQEREDAYGQDLADLADEVFCDSAGYSSSR